MHCEVPVQLCVVLICFGTVMNARVPFCGVFKRRIDVSLARPPPDVAEQLQQDLEGNIERHVSVSENKQPYCILILLVSALYALIGTLCLSC